MSEHFVVTVDCDHFRIFAERAVRGVPTRLEAVETMEFPFALKESVEPDNFVDQALVRPGVLRSWWRVSNLAAELEIFLQSRPEATWDFAASPEFHDGLIERLSEETRRRLRVSMAQDLANDSAEQVRARFAEAG